MKVEVQETVTIVAGKGSVVECSPNQAEILGNKVKVIKEVKTKKESK